MSWDANNDSHLMKNTLTALEIGTIQPSYRDHINTLQVKINTINRDGNISKLCTI